MIPELSIYAILFTFPTVVCLAIIPRTLSIQHSQTRYGLVALLLSVSVWSGGYVGYLLSPTAQSKLAFYTLALVFAFVSVGAWWYFCAAYTGRHPQEAPYRNVAVGLFLFVIALKLSNPLHNLFYTTEWIMGSPAQLVIHHQPLHWIILGLTYAVVIVGFFMLFEQFYHVGIDSHPLVVVLALPAIPAIGTIAAPNVEWLLPLMYEPVGVSLFAIGAVAVPSFDFESVRLTGETDSPAIFFDQDTFIRDYNRAAQRLYPELEGSIGKPIESVNPSLAKCLRSQEIITMTQGDETRLWEISRSPFTSGEVMTGQLATFTDVTERESYRQQLETKTEQLEALNRVIRHDIRNDMTVIVGWAETLYDHVDKEETDALDRVLHQSRHVIELTEIARDFVESLTDEDGISVEPVDLSRILQAELVSVRESHSDAEFRVSGDIPGDSVRANEMLSSVFRNVFENAVRHNDERTPKISITCVERPETVRVRIADNGPGVPDSQKEQIFGKGEKGIASPGTGIGLYLVETLITQFGGNVWVEDNEPKGAVFVIELSKGD